jgi:hypothetical protein
VAANPDEDELTKSKGRGILGNSPTLGFVAPEDEALCVDNAADAVTVVVAGGMTGTRGTFGT